MKPAKIGPISTKGVINNAQDQSILVRRDAFIKR